ncbi:hypothetical protein CCH79_00019456 [Gambusia affinis]|uniref:Reverse transcriptase domain-containing protein n=1 Tax=Gambusia affinis TaxID=33528 RepID=A0A315V2N0_GAMAF|nr:hypothetical protein CCH79_00019456 [Gambusia affinis]
MFADDTTVVGLIRNDDGALYKEEIQNLSHKTKELIVDYRRSRRTVRPAVTIQWKEVERMDNIKFLGIHITLNLTRPLNTSSEEEGPTKTLLPQEIEKGQTPCSVTQEFL